MLDKSLLFSNLSSTDIAKVNSIASIKKYGRGETVFFENTPADRFFIVKRGRVKVYKISKEGREQALGIFTEGSTIGEAAMFGGGRYPANAEALLDCELFFIKRAEFLELLKTNPEISMRMIGILSNRLLYFNRLVEDLSLKDAQARAAKFLLDYSVRKGGQTFTLDIKKQDLARRIGIVSETLSRVLRKFKEKKVLDIRGKEITILDKFLLQRISSGEKKQKAAF